jgi:hypothetical protein
MLFAVNRMVSDADVKPDQQKKAASKDKLMAAVEQKRWESGIERATLLGTPTTMTRMERRAKNPRRLMTRLALVTGFMFAMSSVTVAMASDSLPGSPLYPVKRAVETAKVGLTFDEGNKKLLYMQIAENRMDELEKIDSDDDGYPQIIEDMNKSLEKATIQPLAQAGVSATEDETNKTTGVGGQNEDVSNNTGSTLSKIDEAKLAQIEKRLNAIKKRSVVLGSKLETSSPAKKFIIERKLHRLEIITEKATDKKDKIINAKDDEDNENRSLIQKRKNMRKALENKNNVEVDKQSVQSGLPETTSSTIVGTSGNEQGIDTANLKNTTTNSTAETTVKKIYKNRTLNPAIKKKLINKKHEVTTTTLTRKVINENKKTVTTTTLFINTTDTTLVDKNDDAHLTLKERKALWEQKKEEFRK